MFLWIVKGRTETLLYHNGDEANKETVEVSWKPKIRLQLIDRLLQSTLTDKEMGCSKAMPKRLKNQIFQKNYSSLF